MIITAFDKTSRGCEYVSQSPSIIKGGIWTEDDTGKVVFISEELKMNQRLLSFNFRWSKGWVLDNAYWSSN